METPEFLNTTISCKIQNSQKTELNLIAKKINSTLSAITRILLTNFINEQTTKKEAACTSITFKELPKNETKMKAIIFGNHLNG